SRRQDHHHGHARERYRRLGPPRGPHARRPGGVGRPQRDSTAGGGRALAEHGVSSGTGDGCAMIRSLALLFAPFSVGFLVLLVYLLSSDKGRRSMVLALRSLWLHKLRAFLSVLGIIIGTLAVITLMAFGEGSMRDALEDITRQGATNIIIRSVKPPDDS